MDAAARRALVHAHQLLAELIERGVIVTDLPPVYARDDETGISVTIALSGTPQRPRTTADDRAEIPAVPLDARAAILARLTPTMRSIYDLLRSDRPMKLSVIASKLGKKPGGGMRMTMRTLELVGLIRHGKGGYLLA
ncbi:MAG TPA: hypothetical protein VFE62_26635 [Gemmataceae bacterium]|nr:hypothetical protein [Gemmataceae bacterium]